MQINHTNLEGVIEIQPNLYEDTRGFFMESYNKKLYKDIGIYKNFVQDNISESKKNVLRGFHFQSMKPQGKLVSCLRGKIIDVVVDINKDSKQYAQSFFTILDSKKQNQLWIPPGYAHGFCVLSDSALFHYKCTDYYDPFDQHGVAWNDQDINFNWPVDNPILSEKDKVLPRLKDL